MVQVRPGVPDLFIPRRNMPSNTWVETKKKEETEVVKNSAIDWIKENRETFWAAVGIAVAVVAFIIFFAASYSKVQKNAWQALFMAQQNAYAGRIDEARKISTDIEKNYSRSSAVPFAIMLEGDLDFAGGKYEEAEASYRRAMKKAESGLMPVLYFNICKTYEARRNWDEAVKNYEAFLKKYSSHYSAPEVYMNMAACMFRGGKTEEAKAVFEKVLVLYPDTVWANQAKTVLNPQPKAKAAPNRKNAKK